MQQDDGLVTGDNPMLDRLSRLVCFPYFSMLHRVRWHGADNVPRHGPAIIAPNHQSFYDPVLVCMAANRHVVYMGVEMYFRYPILGTVMRLYGCVPVSEKPYAPSAYGALVRELRKGHVCGIFPEGRRTKDGLLNPGRPGVAALALSSGAPVIPVTLYGGHEAWPIGCALPRPSPIHILFGKPMVFERDRLGRHDASVREEITRQIMLRVADGFAELGRPDLAAASRRKLLAATGGDR